MGASISQRKSVAVGGRIASLSSSATGSDDPWNSYAGGWKAPAELALQWQMHGVRLYDPLIGRWSAVDPLASQMPYDSPYSYSGNDPLNYVDRNGLRPRRPDADQANSGDTNTNGEGVNFDEFFGRSAVYRWHNMSLMERSYQSKGDLEALAFLAGNRAFAKWAAEERRRNGPNVEIQTCVDCPKVSFPPNGTIFNSQDGYTYVHLGGGVYVKASSPSGRDQDRDWNEAGHTVLDGFGLIPVIGEAADGINALWYSAEGDYINAALSAAGMVPFLGWGATGTKMSINMARVRALGKAGEAAVGISGKKKVIAISGRVRVPDFLD